jgi:hypothetical protein
MMNIGDYSSVFIERPYFVFHHDLPAHRPYFVFHQDLPAARFQQGVAAGLILFIAMPSVLL